MNPDYTINDAHKDGFDSGLLYALRYFELVTEHHFTDTEVTSLSEHLAFRRPDRSSEQLAMMIHNNLDRWRG